MNNIKSFIKRNYKLVIGIIMGITISVGIGVSAVATKDVEYDNSKSGLTSTNMQGAIDELNTKATAKIAEAEKRCPDEYECIKKVCEVMSGTGLNAGDEINCNGDDFYVIETSDNSISMLTKYPVLTDGSGQSAECIGAYQDFGSGTGNEQRCILGFNINTYINTFFNNTVGVTGSSSIRISQLNSLGCNITISDEGYPTGNCTNSGKPWLYSFKYGVENTFAHAGNYISTDGIINMDAEYFPVRPVVTIPKILLKS